ncbi:pentraxin fusion protein-like [Leptodactylus fuscus]|uniref:pentraxin fusion protein-like n=1 Tax=Leptodactylus fuscus TaxID=238119 RepID=UPI003F4E8524
MAYGKNVTKDYTTSPSKEDSFESEERMVATELRNLLKHSNAASNVALTAKATQSSTDEGEASNAIDGDLKKCTRTTVEKNPWLTVDLGSVHKVFSIAVTNQNVSSDQDLHGAEIHVGSSATGWKKNPICGTLSSIGPKETFSFNCDGLEGQFVTIVIPDKETSLGLCEVQVFALSVDTPSGDWNGDLDVQRNHHGAKNVAPQGIATQSSYYGSRSEVRTAIDGSLSANYLAGECTHTRNQMSPWWSLDLKSSHRVASVAITNRQDCCRERINGAEIRIGDSAEDGGIRNPRCGVVFRMNYGETLSFNCRGMMGRYVTVVIPDQKQYLSVCEVQVFAVPIRVSVTPEGDHSFLFLDLEGRSFLFPEQSVTDYVLLTPAQPMRLTSFTLCMKLSLNVSENRETILFSYRTLYYDELNLWLESDGNVGFYMSGEGLMFPKLDYSKEWNHLCLTWESKNGRCELWVNGKRHGNKIYRKRHTVRAGGMVILGQDQDGLGDGFEKSQSYVGKIKDLNMWNKVLSLRSLRSMFKGKVTRKGEIFDWSNLSYSLKGKVEVV